MYLSFNLHLTVPYYGNILFLPLSLTNVPTNYNFVSKEVKIIVCVHIIIFEGCKYTLKKHCVIYNICLNNLIGIVNHKIVTDFCGGGVGVGLFVLANIYVGCHHHPHHSYLPAFDSTCFDTPHV